MLNLLKVKNKTKISGLNCKYKKVLSALKLSLIICATQVIQKIESSRLLTEKKHFTYSDTALAPQSNTFPARTPLTKANCLSSQLNFSMEFTAFW